MFDRIITFLKELPSGEAGKGKPGGSDDPRVAAAALMYHVMDADGELHELEDHTLWRIAELIGVDRRDRIHARQKAQAEAPDATGKSTED